MTTTAKGLYHPYAHARGVTMGSFKITANATPTVSDDPGGIVASVSKPAMTTGVYVVTLKRNYSRIHGIAQNNSVTGLASNISTVTAGGTPANTPNTMTIQILDAAANPDPGYTTVTTVAFFGYDT